MNQKKKKITTEEFDKIFDNGDEDILQYADMDSVTKRVNVDFPVLTERAWEETKTKKELSLTIALASSFKFSYNISSQ